MTCIPWRKTSPPAEPTHGTARVSGGNDPKGRPYYDLRWSRFKHLSPAEMYSVVGEHVFPFLRTLGGDGSTYAHHMKDARFTILRRHYWPRWWTCWTTCPWKTATPRAICTSTCWARSPPPAERSVPHPAPHHPADGGTYGPPAR